MDFDKESKDICPACHTRYNIVYYQRRAADEPPDKVIYCSNCPLDINRLSLTDNNKDISTVTNKNVQKKNLGKKKDEIKIPKLSKISTRTYIVVKGNAATRCYKKILSKEIKPSPIIATPVNVNNGIKYIQSYYYINSKTEDEVHISTENSIIAPYVVCRTTDIYGTKDSSSYYKNSADKYSIGNEYILSMLPGSCFTVLRTLYDGSNPYILILLPDDNSTTILSILEWALVEYGTESSIKSILNNTMLNALYTHGATAHDYASAPKTGYTYTWKPDGERHWYIKYGSVWLFCKPRLSGIIPGWNISTTLNKYTEVGPVLDTEVMIGFDPILIDVLVTDNAEIMSISRTLDYVLDEFKFISESKIVDTPIHVREYYRSDKELLDTKETLQYPVDGIVGIQDGSMTIIKLKDEKSIELQLADNGDLLTSDGHVLANSNLQETEEIGNIIEIRFVKQSQSDIPTITEIFHRTDKTKANDMQACQNIVQSISDTPDTLARRNTLQWCNSIRSKLNQVASKLTGKGRVILDIGAGDGQAVSDYSTNPEVTYLLLEPSIRKCKMMRRRLEDKDRNNCRLFESATSIVNALGLLINKKIKYAIVCSTLKDIINQKECIRTMKTCVRCCIASLSISYIAPELCELAIEGLNVIGFGYMYDNVDMNGVLINQHGVIMKYTTYDPPYGCSKDAIVKWGNDKIYSEPSITLQDFKEVFSYKLAKNVVPIITDSKTSLLNTVGNKVYIISSDKYII